MPIVIDPNVIAPPTPVTATSPDGKVTATLDGANAGVYLKAHFAPEVLPASYGHDFATGIAGVSVFQNQTSSVLLTWTGATSQACRVDWSTGTRAGGYVGAAGLRFTPPAPLKGGREISFTFTLTSITGFVTQAFRVGFRNSLDQNIVLSPFPNPAGATRTWTATAFIPEGEEVVSVVLYALAAAPNQTFTVDTLALSVTEPDYVEFFRGGEPVASGFPAVALQGEATAYDHRAPLGKTSVYTARPRWYSGQTGILSEGAALLTPKPTGYHDAWLKSTSEPGLSLRVLITDDDKVWTNDARTDLSPIAGSPYMAGSWDLHQGTETTFTLLTDLSVTRDRMLSLLDSGVLLFQTSPDYDLPDMYVLPGAVSMTILDSGVRDRARLWSVSFTEVESPSAEGSPLFIPGRSYDDLAALGSYDEVAIILPRYDDWIGLL